MQRRPVPPSIYAVNSISVASIDDVDFSAVDFPEEMYLSLDSPRADDPVARAQVLYTVNKQLRVLDGDVPNLIVPGMSLDFFTMAVAPNTVWVDKSIAIGRLRELGFDSRIPIIHRPSGFGKTAIADMLYSFYAEDSRLNTPAATVFQHTHADGWLRENTGSPLHRWIGNLPVLHFDLAALNVSSPAAFRKSLHRRIDSHMNRFRRRFERVIASTPLSEVSMDGHVNISFALTRWLHGPKGRIDTFLCIDNYDYPEIACQSDDRREIMYILSTDFISSLVNGLSRGIRDGIILGTRRLSPDSRSAYEASLMFMNFDHNPWEALGVDVTDEPEVATLFGLTEEEIRLLCRAVGASHVEDRILSDVPYETFCGNVMYCTREVMRVLGKETGRVIR